MASLDDLRQAMLDKKEEYRQAQMSLSKMQKLVQRLEAEYYAAMEAYALELETASLPRAQIQEGAEPATEEWLEPPADFDEIVWRAESRNTEVRLEARRLMQRMGPKAIDPLLRLIDNEGKKRERRMKMVGVIAVAFTLLALLEMTFLDFWLESGQMHHGIMLLILLVILSFGKPSKMHKRAARALARIDDLRVVGPLLEALEMGDTYSHAAAADALKRLLPRLRADHAELLNENQFNCLLRALRNNDAHLVIAILQALEQIGDRRALPEVERLADAEAFTHTQQRIKDAANECLPALIDKTVRERAGQRLLRPSTAPGEAEETLLRPAQGMASIDPQLLLRPMNASDD